MVNKDCFWSSQWATFPPWNYPSEDMNTIGACASEEANAYSSSASDMIKLYYSYWKILPNLAICVEGFNPRISMNVLGWRLLLAVCIADFIVMISFSDFTATFLTKRRIWLTWWLVSVGDLGGTCTPSYIKNYLTSGIKLLKKVAVTSNGNADSCGIASI